MILNGLKSLVFSRSWVCRTVLFLVAFVTIDSQINFTIMVSCLSASYKSQVVVKCDFQSILLQHPNGTLMFIIKNIINSGMQIDVTHYKPHTLSQRPFKFFSNSFIDIYSCKLFSPSNIVGGSVASWLVRSTPEKAVRVPALGCVLRQDTLLSQCLSPPRCINGYRQIVGES